ncbi:hypothetical protein LTR10_009036 [Elasticomyces elasticus]|nr:hypothetical protein LTR10_009036 [Elasticomyces elasticus]KAK4964738.1 hypothetical protein LTR42_012682 [Elasticomyces elasticus]
MVDNVIAYALQILVRNECWMDNPSKAKPEQFLTSTAQCAIDYETGRNVCISFYGALRAIASLQLEMPFPMRLSRIREVKAQSSTPEGHGPMTATHLELVSECFRRRGSRFSTSTTTCQAEKLTLRTTTARVTPLAHPGPVPYSATHQSQGYYTILRPDANYLQHPPRIDRPHTQYPGPHPQAQAVYGGQYAAYRGSVVHDSRYGVPAPQAPAAHHAPFDPNYDYVAAAQRAHIAYAQTAGPRIAHPAADLQIQPQQSAYGAVPQAPAVYPQAELQQQQSASQRFAVPVKNEQFTPRPASVPRHNPVLQQAGGQVVARPPLADLSQNVQQQVPHLRKRPVASHGVAHTPAEDRQQAQNHGTAGPVIGQPRIGDPQLARPVANPRPAPPPVNRPRAASPASESSEDIEDLDPRYRESRRRLALGALSGKAVNKILRRSIAQPNQDSIGYLLRIKCITGLMPEPLRILRVPSTANFHQLHLIVQESMDYSNSHLHKSKISRLRRWNEKPQYPDAKDLLFLAERYHADELDRWHPDEDGKHKLTREVKLWQIYENATWRAEGIACKYNYDFGSPKTFEIIFMGQADAMLGKAVGKREDQEIACLAGEGGPIDEDDDCARRPRPYKWSITQVNKDLKKFARLKAYNE